MSDVIRNATIRLAIEMIQSSGAAGASASVNDLVASTNLLWKAQDEAAESSAKLASAITSQSQVMAQATQSTNAYTGAQVGVYRGAANLVRGLALVGVATGELDAKALQSIVAIEGLAGAFKGAAEMARVLKIELLPFVAVGALVVGVAYELEQAWTQEAREAKAAADQMKTNLAEEKEAAELSTEVWRRWGEVQREGRQDVIRGLDEYMDALRKTHSEEEALRNAAESEFNMKPGERARLNRDRATIAAGGIGVLSDRELRFDLQHSTGTERDSFGREAERRIGNAGGPARYTDGTDEAFKGHIDRAEHAKTATEHTIRAIEQLVSSLVNGLHTRLQEAERTTKHVEHAAVQKAASASTWAGSGIQDAMSASPVF